jgi:hypothetical protein
MKRLIPFLLFAFSTCFAAAQDPGNESDNRGPVKGITSRRAAALVGVAIGLTSVIVGWRAKKRVVDSSHGARRMAIIGLILGLIAAGYSTVHIVNTVGGFGTGGGKAGAIVGLALGCLGVLMSALALSKSPSGKSTD